MLGRVQGFVTLLSFGSLPLGGCRAFRAEIGYGVGIGADVHLPAALHLGSVISGGSFKYLGHNYDKGWRVGKKWEETAFLIFNHFAETPRHRCYIFAPLLMDHLEDRRPDHSQVLEARLFLLFLGIRLGFNPWKLPAPEAPEEEPEA